MNPYSSGEASGENIYSIALVRKIVQKETDHEWMFFQLQESATPLWLMVKITPESVGFSLLSESDELRSGTRKEFIERQEFWLFNEPNDPESLILEELDFASEIFWVVENSDTEVQGREILYRMHEQGILYGLVTHTPTQFPLEPVMGIVVEYTTEEDPDNSDLVVLEIGGEEGQEGGHITVMFGSPVLPDDLFLGTTDGKSMKPVGNVRERKSEDGWLAKLKRLFS